MADITTTQDTTSFNSSTISTVDTSCFIQPIGHSTSVSGLGYVVKNKLGFSNHKHPVQYFYERQMNNKCPDTSYAGVAFSLSGITDAPMDLGKDKTMDEVRSTFMDGYNSVKGKPNTFDTLKGCVDGSMKYKFELDAVDMHDVWLAGCISGVSGPHEK